MDNYNKQSYISNKIKSYYKEKYKNKNILSNLKLRAINEKKKGRNL